MKGYTIAAGYMGYLPSQNDYKLFPTWDEYSAYFREFEKTEIY